MRTAVKLAIVVATALALPVAMLWAAQNRIIYPATPPSAPPEGYAKVSLGDDKFGYWVPPARPDGPVLVFFHGNATDTYGIGVATQAWRAAGYGVLAPEYPGYAGTPGSTSSTTLRRQADLAMEWLKRRNVSSSRIVIEGNSIGSGPAIHAAAHPNAGLVVASGFASLRDVASDAVGPLSWLVSDPWDNAAAIRRVRSPVVILHGDDDPVVPTSHGLALARAAGVKPIILQGDHGIAFRSTAQWAMILEVAKRLKRDAVRADQSLRTPSR